MFDFNASEIITKNECLSFINKEKEVLQKEKCIIFQRYETLESKPIPQDFIQYQEFREKYNSLVHLILKDVINFYRHFLPQKCLIAEFGSFVKGTERLYSDFDFTICYDEPKTEQYEVAEELIDYSLAAIFGYTIDHIHGKFQHYPDMPEVYNYTESDNLYRLIFKDGIIEYKCGPETLCENLMNIKNVRDYNSMITGYEEKYLKKCNIDCLYSISILENTTEHDFLFDLVNLESKYDICDGYNFDLQPYSIKANFQISEIKKLLKNRSIVEFYIFLATLRKKTGFCEEYSMTMKNIWHNKVLLATFGEDYLHSLQKSFFEFIFYWNRIEYSLVKRGIPLSTRCYKEFSLEEFNSLLYTDWKDTTNLQLMIDSRNKLVKLVEDGLKILYERKVYEI